MVNGIRASDSRRFNKGRGLKFHGVSKVRQENLKKAGEPISREYNNRDEGNSLKTLNDKLLCSLELNLSINNSCFYFKFMWLFLDKSKINLSLEITGGFSLIAE